jgi:hypothetical protein
MPSTPFEAASPPIKRSQTNVLEGTATGDRPFRDISVSDEDLIRFSRHDSTCAMCNALRERTCGALLGIRLLFSVS